MSESYPGKGPKLTSTIFPKRNTGLDKPDENPLQGLFLDLLGCLESTGTSPNDAKAKPMTGFCQILNMITETMEAKNKIVNDTAEHTLSIHEITSKSEATIEEKVPESVKQEVNPPSDFNYDSVFDKIFPSEEVELLLLRTTGPEIPKRATDYKHSHALKCLPQEIAEAMKHYDLPGLPRNANEVEEVLRKVVHPISTLSLEQKTKRELVWMPDAQDGNPGQSRNREELSAEAKLREISIESEFYDCFDGNESGDDGHNWSSNAVSETSGLSEDEI